MSTSLTSIPSGTAMAIPQLARIRLLLADGHTLFRQGLRLLLGSEPDLEVVAEVGSGEVAVRECERLHPDVVVLDVALSGTASFEAAQQIRRQRPRPRILFLSLRDDPVGLIEAQRAGADAYLVKDVAVRELVAAIHSVHRGHHFFSARVHSGLSPVAPAPARQQPPLLQLTPRERQVMKLLAEGLSVRKIAAHLLLSMKTVDTHKLNLMRKLDLHNKAQLVQCAVRHHLIQIA